MKHMHFLPLALFVFASAAFGQHDTAENGDYRSTYQGDTWTGVVVSASEQTGENTLSYTKGGKLSDLRRTSRSRLSGPRT